MKKLLLILTALVTATTAWADVEIYERHFPDANFRNWVLRQAYGADGVLTDEEIARITFIDVYGLGIQSLKGIEFFTALTGLRCDNNQLTLLDVSKNTKLTSLVCYINKLNTLNVSKNTALTLLECWCNELTTLDVSKNTALTKLDCSINQLTTLDVSKNTALTTLHCYNNKLTTLDVSQNTALTWLECFNNELTTLDVSKNTALTRLECGGNHLTTLNVSGCTALTTLGCGGNHLTTLNVSGCTSLTTLGCDGNQIKGAGMDVLVALLPTVSNGWLNVIGDEDEQNEMTTVQVAAAKAKGWTPMYYDDGWKEYAGSESMVSDVAINERNFPDARFRSYLLRQEYGADGMLTDEEILDITYIDVNGLGIQSLKGIEFFTVLQNLRCGGNHLTTLDVSQNTALTWLECFNNELTTLDMSKNTALTTLHCYNNKLTTLDVSGCTALTGLDCGGNHLTALDVSGCTALTGLDCGGNQLTTLDVSGCTALRLLVCDGNHLATLDMSECTALSELYCYCNQIKGAGMDVLVESLPTVSNGWLYVIWNEDEQNEMTTTQEAAAKAKGWKSCYFDGEDWTVYIDSELISSFVAIKETNFPDDAFRNYLLCQEYGTDGVLTDQEIASITFIDVFGLDIQSLKGIEFFTVLQNLRCSYNQLTTLDVSKNTALTKLDCRCNNLTTLDVAKCTLLERLDCSYNHLTTLNVSQNTALETLDCGGNQLTTLDVSKNTALTALLCGSNYLTTLNVSKNTALTWLHCYDNQLTTLDVSKNTALTWLECYDNQLTTLDLSQNTRLEDLGCGGNQLTTLDVSKKTELRTLHCYNNKLTTLNVSGCTWLGELYCYGNQIKGAGMDALVESLPTVKRNGRLYVVWNEDEQNEMTTAQVAAAKAKRWTSWYFDGEDWKEYNDSEPSEPMVLDVAINETNFPDEDFRYWVLSKDYGADGVLTAKEIARIYTIRVDRTGIQSLKGIEFFTLLESLHCWDNDLTTLDVSKNTALEKLYCYGNQLTTLDVSGCTELTSLYCYCNQIKGAGMDALVKSLPTVSNGILRVIWNENEGNVMTIKQVAAAKAKGWTPYYYDGEDWKEYAGSKDTVIIAEETTVNPSETAEPGEATTTESGVTISLGYEDVAYTADSGVIIVSSMTNDAVKELIETTQPGSASFNETFKGFYFLLAAGKGKVEFDIKTSGGYSLGVMQGTELVGIYTQTTKGTVTIPYDITEDTWFFAYPVTGTPAAANRAAGVGSLKVYGLRIIPEEIYMPDGIDSLTASSVKGNAVYNLAGQRIGGLMKGLNIVDGKKVMVK